MESRVIRTRLLAAVACAGLSLHAAFGVYANSGHLLPFLEWLLALVAAVVAVVGGPPWRLPCIDEDWDVILFLVAAQLTLIHYFTRLPFHFHYDEFITGYASWALPAFTEVRWFAGYPGALEWLARFPIVWFALQKPFLMLFGPSLDTLRLSSWPYHAAIVAYLYVLSRACFPGRVLPFAATAAYVVLAPALYLGGLGVYFGGSTLSLLGASYHAMRLMQRGGRRHLALTGMFLGAAYLYWAASYVALPLLIGYVALECLARWSFRPLARFLPALLIAAVVVAPFAVYALSHENYFTSRAGQVSLIGGEWAGEKGTSFDDPGYREFVREHLQKALRSIYRDEIGGVTDYSFGHRALFGPATIALGLVGALVALVRLVRWRLTAVAYAVAVVAGGLAIGLFLSIPAGAYHRLAPFFPFVGLLVGAGLWPARDLGHLLGRWLGRPALVAVLPPLLLFAAYGYDNATRALEMVAREPRHDSVYLTRLVEERVPDGGRVIVVAPIDYHLGRELFFRTGGRIEIVTLPYPTFLERSDERAPAIVLRPSAEALARLLLRYGEPEIIVELEDWRFTHHIAIFPGR